MSETLTIGTRTLASDLSLPPQCRTILAHLESKDDKGKYRTITNNESMLVYHVFRLSDVIMKLRRAGHAIKTEMKTDGIGGQYASYQLVRA